MTRFPSPFYSQRGSRVIFSVPVFFFSPTLMFPPGANWEYNANPLSLVETFENSLKYTLEFFEYRYKYMYIRGIFITMKFSKLFPRQVL